MPNLSKIFIGFLLSMFFVCTHIGSAFAITKGGINVADHLNEIPQAAAKMGGEGWIYTMGCPGDAATIMESVSRNPNINLMIRGHYPDHPLTPKLAKAWVSALGSIPDDKFPNEVYFMPANEPNHPAGTPDATPAPTIVSYIKELRKALDDSGVGTRVKLLSPMLDVFYFWNAVHATPSIHYAQELQAAYGQGDFFSQFDGISVNLYADYINGRPNPSAAEIQKGRGYKEFIQTYYGNTAAGKPIYAAETGVIKRPSDSVRYRENIPELLHYYGQWIRQNDTNNWQEDDRFRMFSLFSYDPHGNKTPWIYDSDGGVVTKMKEIQKGSEPTRVSGFNRAKFDAWKAGAGIEPGDLVGCGVGPLYQEMVADRYDTKEEGQVYRLKVKDVPIAVQTLTVHLRVGEGGNALAVGDQTGNELDHVNPLWDKTQVAFERAVQRLKPKVFEPLTQKMPVPTLAQDTYARVCRIDGRAIKKLPDRDSEGAYCGMPGEYCSDTIKEACSVGGKPGTKQCRHDGSCGQNFRCDLSGSGRDCTECFVEESEDLTNIINVNFDIEGKFEQIPGESYPGSAPYNRIFQAYTIPGQAIEENKPYLIVTPPPLDPNISQEKAQNCSQEDFEFLEYAIDVPTTEKEINFGGGEGELSLIDNASRIFRGWFESVFGSDMFRDVTIVFKWRGFKLLATKQNEFLTDSKTGLVMASLPKSLQKVEADHGETNADIHARVDGGYTVTLEPVFPSSSRAETQGDATIQDNSPGPVRIPDPLGEKETALTMRSLCLKLPFKMLGVRLCTPDGVPIPGIMGEEITLIPPDTFTPPEGPRPQLPIQSPDSLDAIFAEAQAQWGVAKGVIAGIAHIEGRHMWGYSSDRIRELAAPGVPDPAAYYRTGQVHPQLQCRVNDCAAAGPMQFLIGAQYLGDLNYCPTALSYKPANPNGPIWPDVWGGFKDQISAYLRTKPGYSAGYQASVCNIRDAILGGAIKLQSTMNNRSAYGRAPVNYSQYCARAEPRWTDENMVKCAAGAYLGDCSIRWPHLGNKTYCEYVWEFSQSYGR